MYSRFPIKKKSIRSLSGAPGEISSRLTRPVFALAETLEPRQFFNIGPAIGSSFSNDYTLDPLGSVPGVSTNYGGLAINPFNTNQLLIGSGANGADATIEAITVTRDGNGHITGFSGTSSTYASAPDIDGGLQFGPGGVLFFTSYSDNTLSEIKPGDTSPDKTIDLTALGIASSTGSLAFVPSGFNNAGHIKILSYSGGSEYDATLSPDGSGTYDLTNVSAGVTAGDGPEGVAFVLAGNTDFASNSALLSDYSAGEVDAYSLDANSNVTGSATPFVTGLTGAEGATVDPITGDFLFSTFGGGNQVFEVQGFTNVLPTADLKVTDSFSQASYAPGSPSVTYTIVVSNAGPSDVTGATVSDLVDSALKNVSYSSSTSGTVSDSHSSGTGGVSDTVTLASGSSITYTVTGTLSSNASGSISDTATVGAPSGTTDPDTTNNSQQATATIVSTSKAPSVIHASDHGGAYNGKAYPATGQVTTTGGSFVATPVFTYYLASDKTFSHPLSGAPANPGDYTYVASFAGNANYLPTKTSAAFKITGGPAVIHAADHGGVFNGKPYAATGQVLGVDGVNLGVPVFTYYLASDKKFSNPLKGAPSSRGSYVFIAVFAGNENYLPTKTSGAFTIK